jgi:TolB protein
MRLLYSICIFIFCLLSPLYAGAQLQVSLTQGVDAPWPIVVQPFSEKDPVSVGNTTVSKIITNDLRNSGQFSLIKPDVKVAGSAAEWKRRGANSVLLGEINQISRNKYQVSVKLLDLYHKSLNSESGSNIILQQIYTVSKSDLRHLSHIISDEVYEKLTGVPGAFATKLAYVLVNRMANGSSRYQLMVADSDGFNPQVLLTSAMPIMSPTWSDSKNLVYVSFEGHRSTIYWQNIATGKRKIISGAPGVNGAPAISPDGKKLALVLTKTGSPKIYVLDLANRNLRRITGGSSIDTEPSWSPGGQSLLFTSNRGGSPQIYSYTFKDEKIKRLTFDGNYNARASYMPHSNSIVMMHRDGKLFGIAKQNLLSGKVNILTRSGSDESPSVSPNGSMIVYAKQNGRIGILSMVSADGRVKLSLPAQAGSVQEPAWSPTLR